ncbi:hypothetical protein GCM10010439_40620 [Actinocorallia aurantiaca]|uniref:Uncharacterized protein n=1 Tax=Actinocorallia aurantiaca TaxID=46204 RepID=A0ABN3UD26_9ACTN
MAAKPNKHPSSVSRDTTRGRSAPDENFPYGFKPARFAAGTGPPEPGVRPLRAGPSPAGPDLLVWLGNFLQSGWS